jgi:hypothetical protein
MRSLLLASYFISLIFQLVVSTDALVQTMYSEPFQVPKGVKEHGNGENVLIILACIKITFSVGSIIK